MTRFFLHFILIAHLGATIPHQASAQENTDEREERGRMAWFVQTSIPNDVDNPIKVQIKQDVQLLSLYNRVASNAVPIPEDGVLRVVKSVSDPVDETKTTYITLAKAVIPPGVYNALVILSPVEERKPDGLVFTTKVISLEKFKGGDFMYINLTSTRVGIEIDSKKLTLKPGGMKIQQVTKKNDPASVPYRYSYYHPNKEKWMPLNASMTITTATRRQLFIFSVNEHTSRIRCKGITFPVEQGS